ncbi:hypothetical protein ACFX1X_000523 [Malus domestica]
MGLHEFRKLLHVPRPISVEAHAEGVSARPNLEFSVDFFFFGAIGGKAGVLTVEVASSSRARLLAVMRGQKKELDGSGPNSITGVVGVEVVAL